MFCDECEVKGKALRQINNTHIILYILLTSLSLFGVLKVQPCRTSCSRLSGCVSCNVTRGRECGEECGRVVLVEQVAPRNGE